MEPRGDGVHLLDEHGADVGVVAYGERVYVNGRVMSFEVPRDVRDQHQQEPGA